MLPLKLIHFIGILLIILQGVFSFNITEFYSTPAANSSTLLVNSTSLHPFLTTTEKSRNLNESKLNNESHSTYIFSEGLTVTEKIMNATFSAAVTETGSKILNISQSMKNSLNESIIIISLNSTFENITYDLVNDTLKSDDMMGKIVESSRSFWSLKRPVDTAAIVAGIFLILGVAGYGSCVIYRRYLQRKYGDSHILSHEEFYDTTDLRYFEI